MCNNTGQGPLMLAHPCSSEGRGLSCIGWGQIRFGTPGAKEKSVCVGECVCWSRGVNSRAPGVTKFIAPGNSNHFLSHHASGYWSTLTCKAEEKCSKEEWSTRILYYLKQNSSVFLVYSICSTYSDSVNFI